MPVTLPFLSSGSTAPKLAPRPFLVLENNASGGRGVCDSPDPTVAAGVPAAPRVAPVRCIPETDQVIGTQRTELLRRVLEAAAAMAISEPAALAMVQVREPGAFCLLTADGPVTYPTYRKWKKDLKDAGNGRLDFRNSQALVPGYARGCRGRKGDEAWWKLFTGLLANSAEQGVRMAYDDAVRTYRQAGMKGGWPKFNHAKYWQEQYGDKHVMMLTRKGETWFRNHVAGYLQRDWDSVRVGEVWVGDHRKTDNFTRVWDEERQEWLPKRIWITAWRDAKSGHFVGWLLYPGDETPNMVAIVQCLVLAILDNGGVPPACLYIDNGADFVAEGFIDPVTVCGVERSIVLMLGIESIHAIKYNAKAKVIENSFKTLIPYFDRRMPGYCGSDKGAKFDDAWKWAKANTRSLPNLEQAREFFGMALADHEERQTQSLIQNGVPTSILWANRTALRPALTPDELHIRALLPLGDKGMREIRRGPDGPSVEVGNKVFYSSEALEEYSRHHWGEKVRLLRDVFAPAAVRGGRVVPAHLYVCAPDGSSLMRCELPETHAAWARTDEDREAIGEGQQKIRRLEKDTKAVYRQLTGKKKQVPYVQVMAEFLHEMKALPGVQSAPLQVADRAAGEGGEQEPGAAMVRREKKAPAVPVEKEIREALENVMFGRSGTADDFADDEQPETAADDAGAAADPELKDALAQLGL